MGRRRIWPTHSQLTAPQGLAKIELPAPLMNVRKNLTMELRGASFVLAWYIVMSAPGSVPDLLKSGNAIIIVLTASLVGNAVPAFFISRCFVLRLTPTDLAMAASHGRCSTSSTRNK